MDKIIKPGIVLFIICTVAATLLGYVFDITREPVRVQEEKTRNIAMQEVLPLATEFTDINMSNDDIKSVYEGTDGGEVVGYAITTAPKGYGGEVVMLTGVDLDGTVTGVSILSMQETPGLGANASNPEFRNQYIGKSSDISVTKSSPAKDNEIEAMTSATITSKAVTAGVNASVDFYKNNVKEAK